MRTFSFAFLLAVSLTSLSAFATNLGPQGNAEAKKLFENYRSAPAVCDAGLPGKRVLLTGFGLFQSLSFNMTGAVAANIADDRVFPSAARANEIVSLRGGQLSDGKFITNQGAAAFQRVLEIEGERYNLCILVLDVLWDSAGAIVAFEMDRFQPERVLMMGVGGGATFEGGALNYAEYIEGHYADGRASEINLPRSHAILAGRPAQLPMSWDNQKIRAAVKPLTDEAGISITAEPAARPGNTYLCNHVSYMALAAAKGFPVRLAGGLIRFKPKMASSPRVGFFHLPGNLELSQRDVAAWGSLVLNVIHAM